MGLWRPEAEAQRREVAVSFGEASLVISDGKSGTALTHWSLPAVQRLNPGALPALYAPAADGAETLEIEDATMIAALEQVSTAIARQRARPGRLRLALRVAMAALVAGLGLFWLPQAMVRHTATVIPPSKRAEIGRLVLAEMVPRTGTPCNQPEGIAALSALRDRVLGKGNGELVVLPDGIDATSRLPGQVILLSQSLIEAQDNPDIVAGFIIAEALRAKLADPMVHLLQSVGLRATFTLLTTGDLPVGALTGYGAELLADGRRTVEDSALLDQFQALGIPSTPYALAIDPTGATTKALIDGDPFAKTPASLPVLADGDWVTLQGICSI